jgi:hypothetical protein
MAVRRLRFRSSAGFSACEHIIFAVDNLGFVDARSGAVYSESLGKERDSRGQRETVARP